MDNNDTAEISEDNKYSIDYFTDEGANLIEISDEKVIKKLGGDRGLTNGSFIKSLRIDKGDEYHFFIPMEQEIRYLIQWEEEEDNQWRSFTEVELDFSSSSDSDRVKQFLNLALQERKPITLEIGICDYEEKSYIKNSKKYTEIIINEEKELSFENVKDFEAYLEICSDE